jgi:hypothetical protein
MASASSTGVGDGERFVDGELLLAVQLVPEGFALYQGHHIVEKPVHASRVEEREDVWVPEPRRNVDLAEEALRTDDGGELGEEHLHGHRTSVLDVVGEVYRRHAAPAQLTVDAVAIGQPGLEATKCVTHEATGARA